MISGSIFHGKGLGSVKGFNAIKRSRSAHGITEKTQFGVRFSLSRGIPAVEKMDNIEKVQGPTTTTVSPEATHDVQEKGEVVISDAAEPDKTYYSKQSVWLMILFSGLAIGSDG